MKSRILIALVLASLLSMTAWADLKTALGALGRSDYETAFKELTPLAEQGNAEAQFNLGKMYLYGWGVKKDEAETARLWRNAAEQGHARAQRMMVYVYEEGIGVPKDPAEAKKWLEKVSEKASEKAQQSRDIARQNCGGFLGIPWGTHIRSLKGMTKQFCLGGFCDYVRKADALTIGKAKATRIVYHFGCGVFKGAEIEFKGKSNYVAIRDELIGRYGTTPHGRHDSNEEWFLWFLHGSDSCSSDLDLRYSYNTEYGRIFYVAPVSVLNEAYENEECLRTPH